MVASGPLENGMDNTRSFIPISKGMMISHYKIIEKIGSGGMGEVYLAEDTKLNRRVALKFLPAQLASDEDFKARFKREAQAAAALNHPNIVTIHEVGEYENRSFFVMEHIEGQPLGDFIKGKELSPDHIIDLAIQICEGLQEAHSAGIVHRDIKASNILVDKNGRVKILDFGLAMLKGASQITKTETTLGTLAYMSPEQVQRKKVDHRSDIFSLGVVLYEMITDQLPFKGEFEAAIVYSIVNDTPEPLARYKVDVPDELQRIVDKALEKDREMRYQTATGMISDLKRIQQAMGTGASLAAARERPKLGSRKNVLPILIPTMAAIILLFILILKPFKFEISSRNDVLAEQNVLAIFYFENLKDPEDSDRLGQILQDLVITDLSELSSIKVLSSQRLFDVQKKLGYTNRTKIDKEIASEVARRAGASAMLSGNLMQLGEKWIITCQLIDIENGTVIKSQRIDGSDLYMMVDDLSSRIREDLYLPVRPEDNVDIAVKDKTTTSMEAYRHYLTGVDLLNIGSLKQAIEEFKKAVEVDPTFNQAYYKMAFAQWWSQDESSRLGKESIKRILDKKMYASERDRLLAEGTLAMIEYRFTEALAIYERMVENYPDDKEIYYVLGLAYINESTINRDLALEAFKKVIELDLTFVLAYRAVYDLYMANRDFVNAMEMANNLITIRPKSLMGYRFLVEAALAKGDTAQISLALEQALKHHKTPEELKGLYMHMGLVCNRIRDQVSSEKYTRMALVYDPDTTDWQILAQLGDALCNQGKFDEAKKVWGKGLELNPVSSWCLGGLWYVARAQRDYDRTIEYAKKLVEMRPQSARRHGELLESYARIFQLDAVDSVLEAGLNAIPSASGKIALLTNASSVSLRVLNNSKKAEQLLLRAVALHTSAVHYISVKGYDIYCGLSEIYLRWRNYEKAISYAEKALAYDSLNIRAIDKLFHSHLYQASYEQAFIFANKMIEINPLVGSSYCNLIKAYIVTEQYEKADSVLEIAIELDPMVGAKVHILVQTAKFYINANKLVKAEQLCKRALGYQPENWHSNQTLGWIYELQGEYKEAEQQNKSLFDLGQGRGYEPDPLLDFLQMGRLYLRQRDYSEAENWFRNALEIDKTDSRTLRFLGYLYCDQQRFDKAKQFAEQALKRDSSFFSYALMAWILIAGEINIDQGIELAQKAFNHPPENDPTDLYITTEPYAPLPSHILGLASLKKQQYREALKQLERAAEFRPEDKAIKRDLEYVRSYLSG